MATANVEPAMVTVWAMATAAVLTMDTANTENKDLQCILVNHQDS